MTSPLQRWLTPPTSQKRRSFNYFPTKEDLAYHRMEDFDDALLEAITNRAPGTSVVDAFGRFVLEPRGFLKTGDEVRHDDPLAVTRVFTDSPTLLARERQIYDRYAERLIDLIAEERGAQRDDLEPLVIARALISLLRAMIDHVRQRALAGASTEAIRRGIRSRGRRGFALLKEGLDHGLPSAGPPLIDTPVDLNLGSSETLPSDRSPQEATMDEPTIACSLDALDYRERLASIRRLGEDALLDVETRPDGAVVSFRESDEVRAELASIVEAEAACCSFLDLSVGFERERLILTIVAPPGALPVVRDMTAS